MGAPYTSIDAAIADYQTYAQYEFVGGVPAAQSFIAAAQYLLLVRPDEARNETALVKINANTIQQELDRARIYINRATRTNVKILGVDEGLRGINVDSGFDDSLDIPT